MKDIEKLTLSELRGLIACARYQLRSCDLTYTEIAKRLDQIQELHAEIRRRKIVNITPAPLNLSI